MDEKGSSGVLLKKGTILHHYVRPADSDRNYKWHYLASQKYTPFCNINDERHTYITGEDILLNEYHLPKLICKESKEIVTMPGLYDSERYGWTHDKPDFLEKNKSLDFSKPWITHEHYFDTNTIDPIRGQYTVHDREDSFYSMCICYEIVLPNKFVEKYNGNTKAIRLTLAQIIEDD